MKILAFADVHLGNYKYPIRDHILRAMGLILFHARMENPDLIIFAGDAFRWKVPPAEDLSMMGNFFARLGEIAPLIAIPGNHDMLGSGVTTLDVYDHYQHFHLYTEPGIVREYAGVQLVLMPWLPQKSLSDFGQGATDTEGAQRALMDLIRSNLTPEIPAIFVGHLTALGAQYREGTSSVVGSDVAWTMDLFDGFDIAILGHVHKPQMIGDHVLYVGSTCPVSFNETGQEKRIILWEDGHIHNVPLDVPVFLKVFHYGEGGCFLPGVDYSNTFLLILQKEGVPDLEIPKCLWHDVIIVPNERELRLRISESTNMSTEEVIARWLELEGYGDRIDEVVSSARELRDGEIQDS